MQRSRNHSVFGRNTRVLSEAVESSLGPCKLDHGGLEPNAVAIYEEVMYRILPLIHSSHEIWIMSFTSQDFMKCNIKVCVQCSHDEFIPSLQKQNLPSRNHEKKSPILKNSRFWMAIHSVKKTKNMERKENMKI